jgi:outer membrane protein
MTLSNLLARLCALFFLFVNCAAATDLLSVYRESLSQDPVFASARSAYIATQEKLPQGKALLLPQVNAQAGANYNDTVNKFNGSNAPGNNNADYWDYRIGVSVTQPIYRRANNATYEQAKVQVAQAETQVQLAAQDLMLRVSQSYFDVLLAQDNLTVIRSQKTAIAEQLEQAKRNFTVGTATITDAREAQARFDLVIAQEIGALNDLEVKIRALSQITGKAPGTLAQLADPIALNPPQPNDMQQWVDQATQSSLQVINAQQSVELAAREVDKARAGTGLTADLIASLTQSRTESAVGFSTDTRAAAIGVQLNYPIYAGGALDSKVREAAANQNRAKDELENARRTVWQTTRQAFLGVTSGLAQVKALEQALGSTQLQLEATKLGQDVGVRTGVDVLNTQQQLASARRDLVQARYNTILNQLKLKAAVGKLTDADLTNVNSMLRRE